MQRSEENLMPGSWASAIEFCPHQSFYCGTISRPSATVTGVVPSTHRDVLIRREAGVSIPGDGRVVCVPAVGASVGARPMDQPSVRQVAGRDKCRRRLEIDTDGGWVSTRTRNDGFGDRLAAPQQPRRWIPAVVVEL
jgi:hypothetical protein